MIGEPSQKSRRGVFFSMLFSTKDKEKKNGSRKKINKQEGKGSFCVQFQSKHVFQVKRLFLPSLCLTTLFPLCFPATTLHKSTTVICLIIIIYCFHSAGNMRGTLQHGHKVSAPENTSAVIFNSTVWYWVWISSLKALFMCYEIQENSPIARQGNTKQEIPLRDQERQAGG